MENPTHFIEVYGSIPPETAQTGWMPIEFLYYILKYTKNSGFFKTIAIFKIKAK